MPCSRNFHILRAALIASVVLISGGQVGCGSGGGGESSNGVNGSGTADTTPPTLAITFAPGSTVVGGALTATFTASEPLVGFTAGDVLVHGATSGPWAAASTSSWTLPLTVAQAGGITIAVAAGSASDAAGNPLAAVQAVAAVDWPATSTADDGIRTYTGAFLYGCNMGYYGSQWGDKRIADLIVGNPAATTASGAVTVPGIGAMTLRPGLYDQFIQQYGVDIRVAEFSHYAALGARDNTVFMNAWYQIGNARRDPRTYGTRTRYNTTTKTYEEVANTSRSWMHANMYLPIWIADAAAPGGRRVNQDNYLAEYTFKIVSRYKDWVKFWEVWNEPDFSDGPWAYDEDFAQSWAKVDPRPGDLHGLQAPIQHNVRLHRVIYEVVKAVDPTAYVTTGGLGYPGFLAAMLRNTDNPGTTWEQHPGEGDGPPGSVSPRYPKTGGAWFDVLSFHAYPQFSLRTWNNAISGFDYHRHSDAAVDAYLQVKRDMEAKLLAAGYGTSKPAKLFICTENNIPREIPWEFVVGGDGLPVSNGAGGWQHTVSDQIGGVTVAVNYLIKALVRSQVEGVRQYYVYNLSDENHANGTANGDDTIPANYASLSASAQNAIKTNFVGISSTKLEGMYRNITQAQPYGQVMTEPGVAFKTTATLLANKAYDSAKTAALNLPAGISGATFTGSTQTIWVLWATTTTDRSETTNATFSFPTGSPATLLRYTWDHAATGTAPGSISSANVPLTGTPVFLATVPPVADTP